MNNSTRRAAAPVVDGGAVVSDGRSTRLPHLRYTGLFSEKQIGRPTVAHRPFTSFGRPWLQVDSSQSSAVNPPRQPLSADEEDSRLSSSAGDVHEENDFRARDVAATRNHHHRVVGKHSGTGESKHSTSRDSQIGGHRRGNVDAVAESGAGHFVGFLPPPPEFSDSPSWATVPRCSMSRMFLESKSISSAPVVGKAKGSGSDDGVNDDDDDDDDDVNNDVPPPPLPTSSPPKIPFSFLHTELENDAVVGDQEKPRTSSLTLSVQSLFGVESDSSESREDDSRTELFSSNDEISKFSGSSIPRTETRTRVEKSRGAAANGCDAAANEMGETVKRNGGCPPPVLSSIIGTNNSLLNSTSEGVKAAASKSNADRRYNTTTAAQKQEIERTSHFEGVESRNARNADQIARDSPQRNEIPFRNAHGGYTSTKTTGDFTEPLHRTSAEDPSFSVSNVRPNPNDKDYGIDRVTDQRASYTVDSVRNRSKERRDRSKGSDAARQIGIANLMNTNAKNQTDETDRRSDRIDGYINGTHFDDSIQERRDYNGNKTSSLLPSSHHRINTDVDLLKAPNKPGRPVLAEKEIRIKSKMFISTLSLYQNESEDSGSPRNSLKKSSTFDNLEKKLRDDARDRLQKLKSPNGSKPSSFPTSGSCLPVIANSASTRGVTLSRENRRSPNYETVLFPPRFGFQSPSFSGSLSRRKPGSLEDLKDWGTRSLPRNMECADKWSVAKFDDSFDNYRKEEEEEATEEAKENQSPHKYYENRKISTNESDKYSGDGGYHRLEFSLPRPAKSAVTLQLQSPDAGYTNKHDETAKETRQNKISNSKSSKANYSHPRTFAAASSNASQPQPDSNLVASNSVLSVFVPPVPPITAEFPDSTVTRPHSVYQNPAQKSSFSTEATSVPPRSFASREILPNISQIPIASADKILPYSAGGHSFSRISSSSSVASPKSFSANQLTQSSLASTPLDFSEAFSHLRQESSTHDSVSDSASTASVPVEFPPGGGEHLPGPAGDGGPSPRLNESREDMVDSELDASFTYFRISHKNNNHQTETETPPPPKYRSSIIVSLPSSADRLVVSDAELCPVPSNQRSLANGKDARVSSFAAGTRQPKELPPANDSFENSVDTYFLRSVNRSDVADAMRAKKFAANEDEFSELRTSRTNESKEDPRWKPLRRERIAEYKQKEPFGNGNTDNNSQSPVERNGVYGVHSSSIKFSESLTNNEAVNSNKRATEVQSLGHHKLHLVDGQTTPKTEIKTSEESRPESTNSTIGTPRTNPFATELSTKAEYGGRSPKIDSKLSGTDENLKRYENKRKPWSTGRETENQNQIGKERGTPWNMETPSSSISRWRIGDKNENRGIPSSQEGHRNPPTPEEGSRAKDSQTRNRMRGLETSALVGSHRTRETDGGKMIPSSTELDDRRGGKNDLIRIDIVKGSLGICFCLEGGKESPHGDGPIRIKRIFHVGAPDFSVGREKLRAGDELISVNGQDFTSSTHYAAWKHLRTLPEGVVTLVVRRASVGLTSAQ